MKFDRDFIVPHNETERDLKIPRISGQDGKLFAGLTQENVEMNRQVALERERAMKREAELHREMYSFGMIECNALDDKSKIVRVHVNRTQIFSVPVISSSIDAINFVNSTVDVMLEEERDIFLYPVNYGYYGGVDSMFEAFGMFWSDGKLFYCRLTYDNSSDDAILYVGLAGAVFDGERICIPDTSMSKILIEMNEISCYM